LSCGNCVNGGETHDDLLHERYVFDTLKSVLLAVGE
jgi:hypothetical protein